jgi:hypothetical protein
VQRPEDAAPVAAGLQEAGLLHHGRNVRLVWENNEKFQKYFLFNIVTFILANCKISAALYNLYIGLKKNINSIIKNKNK